MKLRSLVVGSLLAAVSTAMAIDVTPGGRVGRNTAEAPGLLTIFTDSPVLLDQFTGGFANASLFGTVTSAVYRNDGGTLDFYVQVVNGEGSDPINRVTLFDFTGFTSDVGYRTSAILPYLANGTKAPDEANRNQTGSVIGFDFDVNWETGFNSGVTSYTLVVRTNATEYGVGNVAIINGISDNVVGFAPVPEPATIAALGAGALMLLRRKRK